MPSRVRSRAFERWRGSSCCEADVLPGGGPPRAIPTCSGVRTCPGWRTRSCLRRLARGRRHAGQPRPAAGWRRLRPRRPLTVRSHPATVPGGEPAPPGRPPAVRVRLHHRRPVDGPARAHRQAGRARRSRRRTPPIPAARRPGRRRTTRRRTPWSTPGLVETRFSPDALVWVAVVFHGTAAWRNHGLIIFRFCFIEHLSSCAGQLPRLVAGSRPPGPPMGARASPRRAPAVRRGFPGRGKGDAQRHRLRRRRRP